MPKALMPDDVVDAAAVAEGALRPVADRDWAVAAGPLEWDVEQTITHMIGATAKYTLYLAGRCEHFIGLAVTRWPDATNEEVIDSVLPVAAGLAAVAAATPPGVRAYHVTGPSSAADYVGRACVELLVHTDDALSGLGVAFAPPGDLCRRVLAQQFPDTAGSGNAWHDLLTANGRAVRSAVRDSHQD
jgi:Mycothiol maleylpyruvate isomerase N-terminal domain